MEDVKKVIRFNVHVVFERVNPVQLREHIKGADGSEYDCRRETRRRLKNIKIRQKRARKGHRMKKLREDYLCALAAKSLSSLSNRRKSRIKTNTVVIFSSTLVILSSSLIKVLTIVSSCSSKRSLYFSHKCMQ